MSTKGAGVSPNFEAEMRDIEMRDIEMRNIEMRNIDC